jgi:hypothetical protein
VIMDTGIWNAECGIQEPEVVIGRDAEIAIQRPLNRTVS